MKQQNFFFQCISMWEYILYIFPISWNADEIEDTFFNFCKMQTILD